MSSGCNKKSTKITPNKNSKENSNVITTLNSKATLNIRAELWDEVKRLRGEGYYAVIKYDRIVTNKRDEVARE